MVFALAEKERFELFPLSSHFNGFGVFDDVFDDINLIITLF